MFRSALNICMFLFCCHVAPGQICPTPPTPPDPAVDGAWGPVMPMLVPGDPVCTSPSMAVHSIALRTGKILCIDQRDNVTATRCDMLLVDPITGAVEKVWDSPSGEFFNGHHWFCSGHAGLGNANGDVLISHGGWSCHDPNAFTTRPRSIRRPTLESAR